VSILHGRPRAHRVALAAVGLAYATLASAAFEAWQLQAPPPPTAPRAGMLATVVARPVGLSNEAILALADSDPFDRRRAEAAVFEESAGEVGALPFSGDGAAASRPSVRLQGVVLRGDGGGVAALSVAGGAAQLVRVGQRFEGWQLRRVAPGSATLAYADTVVVLRVGGQAERPTP
jgi:hypothetical protein